METTEVLQALFRWIHVVAGIMWIGHLYFFNFVNGPFEGTLDGAAKKTVVPQLRPRALYWFRWGAAWTWVTGVLLVLLVFYHGQLMFPPGHGLDGGRVPHGRDHVPGLRSSTTRIANAPSKDNKQMAGVGFVAARDRHPRLRLHRQLRLSRLRHPHRRAARHAHGGERLDAHLAGAAEDHHRHPRRPGARCRARRHGRDALAAQHLHVGAARLDDDRRSTRRRSRGDAGSGCWSSIAVAWAAVVQLYKKARRGQGLLAPRAG